jgi:succinate dehydrogenase / fumarate reductase cytochrome b subunit
MTGPQTPLSPFLQYRPQLTSVLSITHRITGVLLCAGAVLLSLWLVAIAAGAETYAAISGHIAAWHGRFVIFGFVFSLYYHLCNGVRHLFWDMGLGLEITTAYRSGYVVLVATLLLTIVTFWAGSAS